MPLSILILVLPINCKNDDENTASEEKTKSRKFQNFADEDALSCKSPINLKGKESPKKNTIHCKEVSVNDDGIIDTMASLSFSDKNEEGRNMREKTKNKNENKNSSIHKVRSSSLCLHMTRFMFHPCLTFDKEYLRANMKEPENLLYMITTPCKVQAGISGC